MSSLLNINFLKDIASCTATVVYCPMSGDQSYEGVPLPSHIFNKTIIIPQDKNDDPFVRALLCANEIKNEKTCILIPGQKFDMYGTRHGRGLGWYDRFLSRVPNNWIRIGVTHATNISTERLERNSWDEPVDWILVYDPISFSWRVTETHSRQ